MAAQTIHFSRVWAMPRPVGESMPRPAGEPSYDFRFVDKSPKLEDTGRACAGRECWWARCDSDGEGTMACVGFSSTRRKHCHLCGAQYRWLLGGASNSVDLGGNSLPVKNRLTLKAPSNR